jgi:hypothetical protein
VPVSALGVPLLHALRRHLANNKCSHYIAGLCVLKHYFWRTSKPIEMTVGKEKKRSEFVNWTSTLQGVQHNVSAVAEEKARLGQPGFDAKGSW